MPTSTETPSALDVRGGDFTAVQDPADGTWTLKDVPVFTTHERDVTVPTDKGPVRRKVRVDRAWLDKAVEKAQRRYREDKYLAPATLRHNGGPTPAEPVGLFLPTAVRDMAYEGKTQPWIFGDVGKIPDATYRKIKAMSLPFRSPETTVLSEPEILALSFLQTETPYFRGPLTTVGKEVTSRRRPRLTYSTQHGQPVLAYASDGDRASFLVRSPMPEAVPATAAASETPLLSDVGPGDKILSALQELLSLNKQVLAAVTTGGGTGDPDAPAEPEGEETAKFSAKAMGALEGKIDALTARLSKMEADKAGEALCVKYAADLASAGFDVPVETLRTKYAALGKDGLAGYVESVKENGTPIPAPSIEDATEGAGPALSDDVMTFASFGKPVLQQAQEFAALYDATPASMRRVDRKAYIARNLQGIGAIPRTASIPTTTTATK